MIMAQTIPFKKSYLYKSLKLKPKHGKYTLTSLTRQTILHRKQISAIFDS